MCPHISSVPVTAYRRYCLALVALMIQHVTACVCSGAAQAASEHV